MDDHLDLMKVKVADLKATDALRVRLRSAGLGLAEPVSRPRTLPAIQAAVAGDGRTDRAPVAALRAGWAFWSIATDIPSPARAATPPPLQQLALAGAGLSA